MAGVSMEASVQRGVTSVSGQWCLFVGAVVPSFSLSQVWPFEAGRVWPDWFFFWEVGLCAVHHHRLLWSHGRRGTVQEAVGRNRFRTLRNQTCVSFRVQSGVCAGFRRFSGSLVVVLFRTENISEL